MAWAIALLILVLTSLSAQAMPVEFAAVSFSEEDTFKVLGVDRSIRTTSYGAGLHLDIWTKAPVHRWGVSLGGGAGRSHSTNTFNDFTFNQTNLLFYWAMISPGYRYKVSESSVELGFVTPILTRAIDYKIPATQTEFPNRYRLIPTVGFEMLWGYRESIKFIQRISFAVGVPTSPIWMAGFSWDI